MHTTTTQWNIYIYLNIYNCINTRTQYTPHTQALWAWILCIDSLLGKDLESNNEITAVAMQQHGKHASTSIDLLLETVLCNPLLGSCNTWTTTIETGVFSMLSVLWNYLEENRGTQLVVSCQLRVEFCTGGYEDRIWAHEVEESPLLEAVAREWLVKTKQGGKGLASAVVIREFWRSAIAL
jgi:hypothetical protein